MSFEILSFTNPNFDQIFKAGAQSQQAKIDELQARVDELQKHSLMLREAAKSWSYNEGEKNILTSQADDLDRILKGNKDEN